MIRGLFRFIHKRRLARRALIALSVFAGLILLSIGGFQSAVAWLPYPSAANRNEDACCWIEDRNGVALAAFAAPSGNWRLPLEESQINPHLLDAIVATEDGRFYQHGGVDWRSALAACLQDLRGFTERRGASTITMQLYRLEHPARRTLWGKIDQAIRATQLEKHAGKREILIRYVNDAPFGGNLVGAGAASWRYFGRPCKDLSLGQAALLAGLPQSPNRFRPDRFPDAARSRRNHVLDRMLALGMINPSQRDEAANEPIDAAWRPLPQEMAKDGASPLLEDLARNYPGRTIRTRLDVAVQKQAAALASRSLEQLSPSNITAVAVVVLDTQSADCLAAVSLAPGEYRYKDIDLTSRPRSSGSTLKPFIYAAAFDAGICTPQTMVDDSSTAWAGYEPANYDHDYRGLMTACDALTLSRNIPALTMLSKVGVEHAVGVMRAMGLATLSRKPERYGLPLAIGGAEVTPMELAQAYATLGRLGKYRPVNIVGDAIDNSQHQQVLRSSSCLITLNCLADPDRTACVDPTAAELAPAWKTGTSSGHKDAWCAAVTPRFTVVVWFGNADGSGSDRLIGQDAATPLALKILAAVDHGGAGFAPPVGFHSAKAAAHAIADITSLALLSPTNGQQILFDPSLPRDEQQLCLRARTSQDDGGGLWWFVDGACVGHVDDADVMWWRPVAGSHEIRVVDTQGHWARAAVSVK